MISLTPQVLLRKRNGNHHHHGSSKVMYNINASWNGNIFRVISLLCGKSPVTGEFPAQRPVTRSFDVFFYLRPNKRLSTQSWGWWFDTPSRSLWRHFNEFRIQLFADCRASSPQQYHLKPSLWYSLKWRASYGETRMMLCLRTTPL